jgi:hypothetical protein
MSERLIRNMLPLNCILFHRNFSHYYNYLMSILIHFYNLICEYVSIDPCGILRCEDGVLEAI